MPLVFSKDPKTGKKTSRYVPPKPKLSRREQREQRAAAYGTGGRYENNIFRGLSRGLGIDKRDDEKQIARLKKYPEQASERYRQVQRNVADAAATGGFNFDNLFMGTNIDRKDPVMREEGAFSPFTESKILRGGASDEVRLVPTRDDSTVNISGQITPSDVANALRIEGIAPGDTSFDPRVVNPVLTPGMGFANTALGDYITGGRGVGGLMSDDNSIFATYPNNIPSPVVNNRPTGNFNNLPPTERSISGGLLGTPTFNFDVAPFGGTGFYDNIMLKAIQDSPFGSGINLNSSLTPSIVDTGFLGSRALNPSGTINIGNIGAVTDQFGRELSGQERIDFINSEFNKLKNRNDALSNFNLGILR